MLPNRPNFLFSTSKADFDKTAYRSHVLLDESNSSDDEIVVSDSSVVDQSAVIYDSSDCQSFLSERESANVSVASSKEENINRYRKRPPRLMRSQDASRSSNSFRHRNSGASDSSCIFVSDSEAENEEEKSVNSTANNSKMSSRSNSSYCSSIGDASLSYAEIEMKLMKNKKILRTTNIASLPDKGARIQNNIKQLEKLLSEFDISDIKEESDDEINIKEAETSVPKIIEAEETEIEEIPKRVVTPEVQIIEDQAKLISDMKLLIESDLIKKVSQSIEPTSYKQRINTLSASSLEIALGNKNEVMASYGRQPKNYGGKLSEQNEQRMVRLTSDAVESLHKMLKSIPNVEVDEEDDPEGLEVKLLPHQKKGLKWLLWRESQLPRGGILADDMGLGKTLTMLSLILRQQEIASQEDTKDIECDQRTSFFKRKTENTELNPNEKENLVPSSGTLVVCPATLLAQWESEVKTRIKKRKLRVLVYHGTSRDVSLKRLCDYDLVVTTYQQVMQEGLPVCRKNSRKNNKEQGLLFRILWNRVILDEAHQIRNYKSKTSEAAYLLQSKRRWAITGTPVQNKEMDFYSLIRFLRISPFDNYTCWKHEIQTTHPQGQRKLSLIVRALVLRRTKAQVDQITGKKIIDLPPKETVVHEIGLRQEEREVYDQVFAFSRKRLIDYMMTQENLENGEVYFKDKPLNGDSVSKKDEGAYTPTLLPNMLDSDGFKVHHMLVLLLRLRQICDHPGLVHAILAEDKDTARVSNNDDLIEQMNSLTLGGDLEAEKLDKSLKDNILITSNPVFQYKNPSSKIEQLVKEIETLGEEKAVIVSQWTSMLDIVAKHLRLRRIKFASITGQIPVKDRGAIVEQFNIKGKNPKVLLLSLAAGGVGLNLIGANHLFLCDMHWNPQLEAQACDRIYRVGQTLPVTIHKFVVMNSVEEKILLLQKKKLELANVVLTGAKMSISNKLSLQDLKALFNV